MLIAFKQRDELLALDILGMSRMTETKAILFRDKDEANRMMADVRLKDPTFTTYATLSNQILGKSFLDNTLDTIMTNVFSEKVHENIQYTIDIIKKCMKESGKELKVLVNDVQLTFMNDFVKNNIVERFFDLDPSLFGRTWGEYEEFVELIYEPDTLVYVHEKTREVVLSPSNDYTPKFAMSFEELARMLSCTQNEVQKNIYKLGRRVDTIRI